MDERRTFDLTDLAALDVTDPSAAVVTWQGRRALRLESGFALVRGLEVGDGVVEIDLGVEAGQGAYPGLAFRGADPGNIELIYCQPHTSGQWDALQYDPVFQGCNTWQVYNGPDYQGTAEVPSGTWITLRVELRGTSAAAGLAGEPALVVRRLAHGLPTGRIGVWTFRPAYFGALRVLPLDRGRPARPEHVPQVPPGLVTQWWLDGYGPVTVEENGTLNLNRCLRQTEEEAVLRREFDLAAEAEVDLRFGFSDQLRLLVDGAELFSGENRFRGFADRGARGYINPGDYHCRVKLGPGRHTLTAALAAREPFGWGLALRLSGQGVSLR